MTQEMTTETTELSAEARAELEGFQQGFSRVRQSGEAVAEPTEPEDKTSSPEGAADHAGDETEKAEDELAGLPPRVRALLQELEQQMPTFKATSQTVAKVNERLSKAEGRLGDVHQRVKALPPPPPPAAPKIEQLEKLRMEGLPEVADAIEAALEARLASANAAAPAAHEADPTPADREDTSGAAADSPSNLLDQEEPDWRTIAGGQAFSKWLTLHNPKDYEAKIRATREPGVMLAAIARFKDWSSVEGAKAQAAAAEAVRVAKQREARAAAAVVNTGSARRTPATPATEQEAFLQGYRNRRI